MQFDHKASGLLHHRKIKAIYLSICHQICQNKYGILDLFALVVYLSYTPSSCLFIKLVTGSVHDGGTGMLIVLKLNQKGLMKWMPMKMRSVTHQLQFQQLLVGTRSSFHLVVSYSVLLSRHLLYSVSHFLEYLFHILVGVCGYEHHVRTIPYFSGIWWIIFEIVEERSFRDCSILQ